MYSFFYNVAGPQGGSFIFLQHTRALYKLCKAVRGNGVDQYDMLGHKVQGIEALWR